MVMVMVMVRVRVRVRVMVRVRVHLGDVGGPAHHHELVDLALAQAAVLHHAVDGVW